MEPKYVTVVEAPDPGGYGLFKVKGLEKTIFRYEYDGETVTVENGTAFLLDIPGGNNGRQIDLKMDEERRSQYEKDINHFIEAGKTSLIFTRS